MVDHSWIEQAFPLLTQSGYKVTSEPSDEYNCVAYAAGKETEWWSDAPGYFWPVARSDLVQSLVAVFESLGFQRCDDATFEEGFQKVALYAKGRFWTHVAKQSGQAWKSKLGSEEDIEHAALDGITGDNYGQVYCIMRRSQATMEAMTHAS